MKENEKKLLATNLSDITATIVAVCLISAIAIVCWNHRAQIFHLCTLGFFDMLAIFGLIWCVSKTISIGKGGCDI